MTIEKTIRDIIKNNKQSANIQDTSMVKTLADLFTVNTVPEIDTVIDDVESAKINHVISVENAKTVNELSTTYQIYNSVKPNQCSYSSWVNMTDSERASCLYDAQDMFGNQIYELQCFLKYIAVTKDKVVYDTAIFVKLEEQLIHCLKIIKEIES